MRGVGDLPNTLTEAEILAGVYFSLSGADKTESNSRSVPYSELYRGCTSVIETPAEYIQKAAEDEERRKAAVQ